MGDQLLLLLCIYVMNDAMAWKLGNEAYLNTNPGIQLSDRAKPESVYKRSESTDARITGTILYYIRAHKDFFFFFRKIAIAKPSLMVAFMWRFDLLVDGRYESGKKAEGIIPK